MADEPKLVRVRHALTGVVVQTTEENAGRLSGYEPAGAQKAAASEEKAAAAKKAAAPSK